MQTLMASKALIASEDIAYEYLTMQSFQLFWLAWQLHNMYVRDHTRCDIN